MNRRHFISTATGLVFGAAVGFGTAHAGSELDYKPGLIKSHLDAGKTVFVDYSASWCGTCQRQARVINDLRKANPAYDKAMVFVRVDWDDFKTHEVTTSRQIPRRSTLLVLKGDEELGRIVAGTSVEQIKGLMDEGVAAGS
ncbi:thioredoxin domain-containing protein [Roseibium sp. TrichSKD4]|uniref:thioredoxin family protein n=1 Tax=Roseibium sp. TrichSKD4 TaxID=744980 RepID=UPI0001E56EB6|nr:thioredoxin family protein [Roseibium sp. TrichSKD4]EFO31615.1 thioredoxin domain-containing protein [Roseibium sp. TrichSKD4]